MSQSALEDAQLIKMICDRHQLLVAAAESVTVGHLQALLAAVPGASTYFRGGVTTYSIEEKTKLLNVDRHHAAAVNCVSQRVTTEMARGITELFAVQIGIATTGYAEPMADTPTMHPHAYYAIWDGTTMESGLIHSGAVDRVGSQSFYAETALNHLRLYLEQRYG
jgi:nicotinamide-nucleotide amidase